MDSEKRRKCATDYSEFDDESFRKKRVKTKNSKQEQPNIEDEREAELLSLKTIREGMVLLGCVIKFKDNFILMSLPGCLTGVVQANNISDGFIEFLSTVDEFKNGDIRPYFDLVLKVGMVYPCKVIDISGDTGSRTTINLSLNPKAINGELRGSSVFPKMVLYGSIKSKEDHGYVIDVGIVNTHAFFPTKHLEDSEVLQNGLLVPFCVEKAVHSKQGTTTQVYRLDFNDDFPEIPIDVSSDFKLSSLTPGARIRADVIEVKHPFVFMKFGCFDACASILSLGRVHRITVGSTILGTVLYVHPITHMIYVMLNLKPSPNIFDEYFGLKRFDCVDKLKFHNTYKNHSYFKINKGTYGFINIKEFPNKEFDEYLKDNPTPKAFVVSLHYMDNLVQLTTKMDQQIISPEAVQIGDVYEAVVKKHVMKGMVVKICPGLHGFVRLLHMSDVYVTKPELLYPVDSKVKCRVLSKEKQTNRLKLSCKESILNLPENYVLTSYENAQIRNSYKGVIVKKTDTYMLVEFFNDVQGIIPASSIPSGSVFYEGQVVACEVCQSTPSKKQLKLSLDTNTWCPIGESDDAVYNLSHSKKYIKNVVSPIAPTMPSDVGKGLDFTVSILDIPVEAVIENVKGDQLNVSVLSVKGRVHITNLGCITEGLEPLSQFSAGQKIGVYILGQFKKQSHLKITDKKIYLAECSLINPPLPSFDDLGVGSSFSGFVKKVGDVSAIVWLSPTKTGVLEYLHFSNNLKEIRKVHKYLKVGMCLNVSILEKGKSSQDNVLTKIEKNLPEVGKNCVGLIQVACTKRGVFLKLPFGYQGFVELTDISDIYVCAQSLVDKCIKLKYVICHVLEVNHELRSCEVSLRKSRVYGKKVASEGSFCPEILVENLKVGDTVKGFVKASSLRNILIVVGRNLWGNLHLHACSITDCSDCKESKRILSEYPAGSIIVVDAEKIVTGGKSVFKLSSSKNEEKLLCNRLNIKEDISWEEVE